MVKKGTITLLPLSPAKLPGLSEPSCPVPKMLLWYAMIMGSALKSAREYHY